jgi:mono/diheme cytochrome c family protein
MKKLAFALLALAACHHASQPPPEKETPPPAATDPLQDQIAAGQKLYGEKCARCHGDAGEGSDKAPPVVGADAFPLHARDGQKRDVDFHTAADVFAWATTHMPPTAPGSLSADQYLAIFAFDLTANGVKLTAPLDGAAAQSIVLHEDE